MLILENILQKKYKEYKSGLHQDSLIFRVIDKIISSFFVICVRLEIQRQLLTDYKEDIRKYAEGMDQTRILNVFNQIPPQLAKENKKFQIS